MGTVVGFISEKGGTGKTTCCYHIAVGLHRFHGKRVMVLDADYQRGGITGRFFPDLIETFRDGHMKGTTLFHKFQQLYSASQQSPDIDVYDWQNAIDVVPADPRLANVTKDKLPSQNNIKENSLLLIKHLAVIEYVLQPFKTNYDYILIDSHPEVSDVLRCIIFASDFCVSPVKLDRQSSIGVATILAEINNVNADVEMIKATLDYASDYQDTKFAGSIGMMTREYGEFLKQTEQLEYNRLRRTGGVFKSYVTEGDGLRHAAADRVPVYDVSGYNARKQSNHFQQVTKEFLSRCL